MVTINHIEELLDKKLAKLENNIIGQLQSSNSTNTITDEPCTSRNKDTPTCDQLQPQQPHQPHQPAVKTFNNECIDLVVKVNCAHLLNS